MCEELRGPRSFIPPMAQRTAALSSYWTVFTDDSQRTIHSSDT